jgi:hypothetical protein
MEEDVWKKFFKENIAGVLIGVIGLVAAFVSALIGTDLSNININVRWFIGFLILFLAIISIMIRIISKYEDILKNGIEINNDLKVKTYSTSQKAFIIKSENRIPINTIMSVFYYDEELEVALGICKFINRNEKIYTANFQYFKEFNDKYPSVVRDLESANKNQISKLLIKNFIISE